MARFSRVIGVLLLLVFLLGTNVFAKRPFVAPPNGDLIGVNRAKNVTQYSDDVPGENGGSGSTFPPDTGARNTNIKT